MGRQRFAPEQIIAKLREVDERCIDTVGTLLETDADARAEAVRRAGTWIANKPHILVANQDCRMEVSLADLVPFFTIIMFSVDLRSFGKGR